MSQNQSTITQLNERSREIFRYIVDSYLSTGSPVGSRTISNHSGIHLSAASIRNTMADLEDAGLLFSPHTSAGRLPTELGLRLYIDGLMQVGGLSQEERKTIEATCVTSGNSVNEVLDRTTAVLSGLSSCASIVIAPKENGDVRQIQFVEIAPRKILIVLVMQNGLVENRILDTEEPILSQALIAASNYLNAKLAGQSIAQAQKEIQIEIDSNQSQLDILAQKLVTMGLALPNMGAQASHIIVRGQSRLLEDVKAIQDLERARGLLNYLEEQKNMLGLLKAIDKADGVQIFIGTENKIFDQSGWSMIISPYKDAQEQIIGAIGVIGPTRLNYDRIIPMVDFTSRAVSRLMENQIRKLVDEAG